MNFINLFRNLFNTKKRLDINKLPSQGLFYRDDFKIYIKKVDAKDIVEYEYDYDKEDLGTIIYKLKSIVEKNTSFSKGYNFSDIKSIDIVFIFLEIVGLSKGRPVRFNYIDDEYGTEEEIEFVSKYFNYFELEDDLYKLYDNENKQFIINGYKYTLPSIGIENCLTNYLISKSDEPDAVRYNKYNYDFTFFLGDKKTISFKEIDNLIQIFNFDMEDSELKKVRNIVKTFQSIQRYSLKRDDKIIEINSKIDLEKIWK
jgi:transposase